MAHSSKAYGRYSGLPAMVMLAFSLLLACGENQSKPSTGSNSNWLLSCQDDEQCPASTACVCGACSATCSTDADCGELLNGHCVLEENAAVRSQCSEDGSALSGGLCLPSCSPGSCEPRQACLAGSCVIHELPDVEFCGGVQEPQSEDRIEEENLIALIQERRESGDTECQAGAAASSVEALRLDARLTCAARVLAYDSAAGTAVGPLSDAEGRSSAERLELAGYAVGQFGEMYLNAPSAQRALELLLTDSSYCDYLVNPDVTDVGVGYAGGIYIITLARP